jgi:two-component sensor histidine kinase/ABC-type amino acid transport substrate-binding protein
VKKNHRGRSLPLVIPIFLAALAAAAWAATAPAATAQAATAQAPSAQAPLRVLTDDSYPPYSFRTADGELEGILVDQWHEWERTTGRKVELMGMAWQVAQRRMLAGEADVIDTMFDTPERRQFYLFGPPYAAIDSAVFFQREIGGIAKISDLRGFRVAVKSGDACIEVLKTAGVVDVAEYPDYESIMRAAASGAERIFCIDRPPALYYLYKLGISDRFHSSVAIRGGEFHRAVLKGHEDILREVDEGFARIPRATLNAIDTKWMGSAVPMGINLRLLRAVGIVGAALLLVLSLFMLVLRKRVSDATKELRVRLTELEASQARNRAFIAALPDLFFVIDREGLYLECMAASEDLLVVPRERLLGRRVKEVIADPTLARRMLDSFGTALTEKRLVVLEYDLEVGAGPRKFEGRVVPLDANRVILVVRDITMAKRQEQLLRESLAEKEILLREIHHRVKNNLQVISSIVSLEDNISKSDAERKFAQDTQTRIRSMAQLHEILYGSGDLGSIDPARYLSSLASELASSFGSSRLRVEAESGLLSLDEAMPFGLIANELMCNALKYAYPQGADGRIVVRYSANGGKRLEVADDGVGLGPDTDPATVESMGFTLVRALVAQLGGRLSTVAAHPGADMPGFRVTVEF